MSIQITEAFVQQYDTTFKHVAQQSKSRLETKVKVESGIKGASKSVNRLGLRSASLRTTRHGDTPLNDQAHSTRFVDLFDYEDGDMIDDQDKLRMLIDPTSDYIMAMVNGMNRKKDDVIIACLNAAARSGASSTVALTAGQQIANGATALTKAKIIAARKLFRTNEADNYNDESLVWVYGSSQMSDILTDTTLTSMDFLTVGMLQEGKVGTNWMGFEWIPSERLPKASTIRSNFAFAKSGVCLGVGEDIKTEVGKDPTKAFNVRAYCKMSLGAVRLEEEKVVQIDCVES